MNLLEEALETRIISAEAEASDNTALVFISVVFVMSAAFVLFHSKILQFLLTKIL